MEQKRQIAAIAESEEERMLLVRVCDRLERAREREMPAATAFLSQREQALIRQLLPQCAFFGGTEGAERAVAFYLPEYLTREAYFDEDGPVACLRVRFYEENSLSHRDILGALMGLGIRRDAVGDICLHEKHCDIFILSELTRYLLDNLTSAGRQHVTCAQIALSQAEKTPQKLREVRVTVSSLRLDAVLAAAFHLSRGVAAEAVNAGRAAINSLTSCKPDRLLSEGDEVSLRGSGKFRILTLGGETKKGRLALTIGIFI
ncbi:MAG: RNA-binding protein [Faecousia sp.]